MATQYERDKYEQAKLAAREHNEHTLNLWFAQRQTIPDNLANRKEITEYVDMYSDDPLTFGDFDFAARHLSLATTTFKQLKKDWSEQTASEIRQDLNVQRAKVQSKYHPYGLMPRDYVPKGKVRSVPLDSEHIRAMSVPELRSLLVRWGERQVNDRINGR